MDEISAPYCGPAPDPGRLLTSWNLDPWLLAALAFMALGVMRAQNVRAFWLAWGALVLAFVSPLCALTVALFSARTLHHLVLVSLAAPALALAFPLRFARPGPAFAITVLVLVGWHVPALYAAAWDSAALYWAMQLALLLPAWAFWSGLARRRAGAEDVLTSGLMVAGLAGAMGMIGAILTFAPGLLYVEHLVGPTLWGLEPLADQQLAGLIMWVPGMLPMAVLALILARRAWDRAAGEAGA